MNMAAKTWTRAENDKEFIYFFYLSKSWGRIFKD